MCKFGLRFFANIAFFRVAQNYLMQTQHFSPGPKPFCKSTMEAVKMLLNPTDFDVQIRIKIFCKHCIFSPGPKVLIANIVFFRLAQKYLVQIQHFFAWPKTILQKYNGSCKNALNPIDFDV